MSILICITIAKQKKQDSVKADGSMKTSEDELTCTVCLEQVNTGELIRSLPCLHQVIDIDCLTDLDGILSIDAF